MSNTSLSQVQPQAQAPTCYRVYPSIDPNTAGYVRCTVVYADRPTDLADEHGLLAIRMNGNIEVISKHYQFIPTGQKFSKEKRGVALSGYESIMIGEDERGLPKMGKRFVQVGVSRRAWATACLFAADVIDGRALAGAQPTPLPPAPPLVDLWSDIPFSVVVA